MKVFISLNDIKSKFKNSVITIGNFDGVHLGHQALFHEVIDKAGALGGTSIVMTFEPHPLRVFKKNKKLPLITLYEQKSELIASLGIDVLICIPFTVEFASLTPQKFIEDILVNRIGIKTVIVGRDYTFGKDRMGNIDLLKEFSKEYGYEVIVSNWIQIPNSTNQRISSTRIRELVLAGNITEAKQMLGRNYQIRGVVVQGRNRGGRLLGFPTANINLRDELCPKMGVYAVTVECRNNSYKGVANIGYSPTFGDYEFTVEVHIFDFHWDIYNEQIRVNFIKRIRNEKKFSSVKELAEQIENDINTAHDILINK